MEEQEQELQEQTSGLYQEMASVEEIEAAFKGEQPEETPQEQVEVAPEVTLEPVQEQPEQAQQPEPEVIPNVEFAPRELTADEIISRFQDKKALLKALGLDDYAVGAVEYYQQTGDLTPYLEAKSVDFNKIPEDAIVERKLREQYASQGLSGEELDLIVQDEINTRYKLDPDTYSERETQLGRIRMKADAGLYRKEFIDRQNQFAPPPPAPEPTQPSMEERVNAAKQAVLQDQYVQQFVKNPIIELGEGDLKFNYEAKNPQAMIAAITDPTQVTYYTSKKDEYGRVVTDAHGNPIPDYAFLLEIAAHMTNRKAYNELLVKHGKSLGIKPLAQNLNPEPVLGEQKTAPAQEQGEDAELRAVAAAMREKGWL